MTYGFIDREHVVAINTDARNTVSGCFVSQAGQSTCVTDTRRLSVQIILNDENNGQFPACCEVHPFVESTVVAGAITKEANGHLPRLPVLRCNTRASSYANATGHDAICPENTNANIRDVH
jgi:hypothetical protein